MDLILNPTYTLMLAVLVLYTGRILNKYIPFLTKYNIPEPVGRRIGWRNYFLYNSSIYGIHNLQ